MSMSRSYHRKKPMAEINIVPYVDVMLVLLVIFMITTPLLTQGVRVDLPKASAQALKQAATEPLIISVNSDGEYFLNVAENSELAIEARALQVRVAAELVRDPARQVLVRGDKQVNYGQVVTAMVLLQKAGATSVGLVTDSDEAGLS